MKTTEAQRYVKMLPALIQALVETVCAGGNVARAQDAAAEQVRYVSNRLVQDDGLLDDIIGDDAQLEGLADLLDGLPVNESHVVRLGTYIADLCAFAEIEPPVAAPVCA